MNDVTESRRRYYCSKCEKETFGMRCEDCNTDELFMDIELQLKEPAEFIFFKFERSIK